MTFEFLTCALALAFSTSFAFALYTVAFRRAIPYVDVLSEYSGSIMLALLIFTALDLGCSGRDAEYAWERMKRIAIDLFMPVSVVITAMLLVGPLYVLPPHGADVSGPIPMQIAAAGALIVMGSMVVLICIVGAIGMFVGRYLRGERILGK